MSWNSFFSFNSAFADYIAPATETLFLRHTVVHFALNRSDVRRIKYRTCHNAVGFLWVCYLSTSKRAALSSYHTANKQHSLLTRNVRARRSNRFSYHVGVNDRRERALAFTIKLYQTKTMFRMMHKPHIYIDMVAETAWKLSTDF